MASLVRQISGLNQVGYGVNLWELRPVSGIQGAGSNAIGMVAELPWGPEDEVTTVTTPAEFFAAFYPSAFGTKDSATYPAIRALLNKALFTKGGLQVVRVGATSAAKATRSVAAGTGTLAVTAKYNGAIGNGIYAQWLAATDENASHRNLAITVGSSYSALYENLTHLTAAAVNDPLVDVVASSPTAVPSIDGSAVALATGSDGSAVAADYVGADDSAKGIRLFYSEAVDCDVLFVAECPSALLDDVNDGLLAFAGEDKGIVVLCTVASQTASAAITYVADYRDDRCVYTWPLVKTKDWFDADADEVTVDGNAFAAALFANVDPWLSPGGNGKVQGTTDLLSGITGLESEGTSRTNMDLLNAAGIAPWADITRLGFILRRAVTTSLTGRTRIASRRMTDYLVESIGSYAQEMVDRPLDIDLSGRVLGTWTGQFVSAVKSFLENELGAEHIRAYAVDPYSENTQAGIDAGRWLVLISVKLLSSMEEIVLKANIGETVEIA